MHPDSIRSLPKKSPEALVLLRSCHSTEPAHFSAGAVAVGAGAEVAGAAAVAGAGVSSVFCSAPKSGSSKGPLVADMPGAGFVVGIAGKSADGAGAGGWEA